MKLRYWQAECINLALKKYTQGNRHFLALATPGAGKTVMAATLAKRMLDKNLIDIVFCFSPSSVVCTDFSIRLRHIIGERFDGLLGSKGDSLTYQSMQYLSDDFWTLLDKYRVFIIFDEIHHCSGSSVENANTWDEQIILNIQDHAEYTIALTGTPWRSDAAPIVLSNYSINTNKIVCDYIYGLADAIRDNVCRTPKIIAIDNNHILVKQKSEEQYFNSFNDLLTQSAFPYQEVIYNEKLMLYLIGEASKKLNQIRKSTPQQEG